MIWKKYTIQTTTQDADLISAVLMDFDIYDVQVENNVQLTDEELNQMYADFVKELPPDDGSCTLSFYIEHEEDALETKERLAALQAGLQEAQELYGIAPAVVVCEDVDSADWENNWKEFFKPFSVERILIAPTWEEIPDFAPSIDDVHAFVHADAPFDTAANTQSKEAPAADLVIRIDPGMAFGTGTHETTRLCLRALQEVVKAGDTVLDLGCGSGILGIAAQKLGAEKIVSVDIDETAVQIAKENFAINGVSEQAASFYVGNVVTDTALQTQILQEAQEGFDLVAINILADVIAVLMPILHEYVKVGGTLITSGILLEKEPLITDAIAQNLYLELGEVHYDGDWVSIAAKRK